MVDWANSVASGPQQPTVYPGFFVSGVSMPRSRTRSRVTAHAMRHTAAALAISAGGNPKVVQRVLGHASGAMPLDVYADLFESDLDSVAERLRKRAQNVLTECSVVSVFGAENDPTSAYAREIVVPSVRFGLTLYGF